MAMAKYLLAKQSPRHTPAAKADCQSWLLNAKKNAKKNTAKPCFVGTPAACVDQIGARISECGADEAVLQLLTEDIDARLAGYRLLAEAAGLTIVERE